MCELVYKRHTISEGTAFDREGRLTVLVLEGPGDALCVFDAWRTGCTYSNIASVPNTSLIYDAVTAEQIETAVVAPNDKIGTAANETISVENCGDTYSGKSRLQFHIARLVFAAKIAKVARTMQANVIVTSQDICLPVLWLLTRGRIKIVLTLHCVLWPQFTRLRVVDKIRRFSSGFFIRRMYFTVLSISNAVTRQVEELTGNKCPPVLEFLPKYRPGTLECIPPPPQGKPYRVLYVGRITHFKGLFDLLKIAHQIGETSDITLEFEVCGDGPDLPALRKEVAESGNAARVVLSHKLGCSTNTKQLC